MRGGGMGWMRREERKGERWEKEYEGDQGFHNTFSNKELINQSIIINKNQTI